MNKKQKLLWHLTQGVLVPVIVTVITTLIFDYFFK